MANVANGDRASNLPVPSSVRASCWLALGGVFVGYLYGLSELFALNLTVNARVGALFLGTLTYLPSVWFIHKIYRGRNWARWILIVGAVLMPFGVLRRLENSANEFYIVTSTLMTALWLLGAVLLFTSSARSWFRGAQGVVPFHVDLL